MALCFIRYYNRVHWKSLQTHYFFLYFSTKLIQYLGNMVVQGMVVLSRSKNIPGSILGFVRALPMLVWDFCFLVFKPHRPQLFQPITALLLNFKISTFSLIRQRVFYVLNY